MIIASEYIFYLKKKETIINIGKDLEKLEPLYIAGGNVKWYSHFGK